MHILGNQLSPNSGLDPPTPTDPKKLLRNMRTETGTFGDDNVTKNYKKIIDLGLSKGSGMGND